MRITGGTFRGIPLYSPKNNAVRPTSDKTRQAVFNMLGNIEGTTFIDLFAGTGSVGFEALSRGAKHVVFADKSSFILKKNSQKIKLDPISIIQTPLPYGLGRIKVQADIIFVDPPFTHTELLEKTISLILEQKDLLSQESILIVQQSSNYDHHQRKGLHIFKQKNYGESTVIFYRKEQ